MELSQSQMPFLVLSRIMQEHSGIPEPIANSSCHMSLCDPETLVEISPLLATLGPAY